MRTLKLTILTGPNADRAATASPNQRLTVGRSSACDLSIVDLRMSRVHFIVENDDGDWTICDQTTSNGTQINGVRADGAHRISSGDVIQAGDTRFQVATPPIGAVSRDDRGIETGERATGVGRNIDRNEAAS